MKCPHCGAEINIGEILATVRSAAKREASRANGRKAADQPTKRRNDGPTERDENENEATRPRRLFGTSLEVKPI